MRPTEGEKEEAQKSRELLDTQSQTKVCQVIPRCDKRRLKAALSLAENSSVSEKLEELSLADARIPDPRQPCACGCESSERIKRRLQQRQKQIDFGKNTEGYRRYRSLIPIARRDEKRGHLHSPDKYCPCSKSQWDSYVRQWRRMLHAYDPDTSEAAIDQS